MINHKSVLAIIPARGGSKGLPRKNIHMLGGKPMIAWTIEEARKSVHIDRLVLSSEDPEIIDTAKSFGCDVPFVRPEVLARDETPGIDVVLHALEYLPGYDIVMVLQPTSPLRKVCDIDGGLLFFDENSVAACVSVSEVSKSPYWMFEMDARSRLTPLIPQGVLAARRQDLPRVYMPNGALFIGDAAFLKARKTFYTDETIGYVMPRERSRDVDTAEDLAICEFYLEKQGIPEKPEEPDMRRHGLENEEKGPHL